MTVGVYFRGLVEQADGTVQQVPLAGSFRVLQGGMEKGVIEAGETAVAVDGSDPVTVLPMPETIEAGWDLTGAGTTVSMVNGGNVTVPILVEKLEDIIVTPVPETPVPTAKPVSTATPAATAAVPAPTAVPAQPTATPKQETESASETKTPRPTATPTPQWNMTPVPTTEPTPEPKLKTLKESAETGSFHIKVYNDTNTNGECGPYEKGVSGIHVYLLSKAEEAVAGGVTGSDGEITLHGLQPGVYRIRVVLPEEWGFSRKGKEGGLNRSVMDFSSSAQQDSDEIRVSAGETVERGVGVLKDVVVDGTCWLDQNADGVMDANEPRIAGARITLSGQKNGLVYEVYTNAKGYFKVTRLRAGYYDFTSYAPEGLMFTRYSRTGGKNRSVFTTEGKTKATKTLDLNDGFNDLDQNIGFTWQASVSGMVFLDGNYNGLYDEGEKPMAGVKVTASKQNKDEEVAVAYSGKDGRYVLPGLRGSTYKIRAVLPEDGSNFTVTSNKAEGNHFEARDNRR